MTAALNIFIRKITMEKRIPFEITAEADPFYSENNIGYFMSFHMRELLHWLKILAGVTLFTV